MLDLLDNVLLKTIRDQRRALAAWALALALLVLMMAAFYPSLRAQADEFQQLIDSYPPAFKAFFGGDFSNFSTPAGYLRAELFSAMLPLLFLVYAVARAGDLVAGEEERGGLDLLLTHPVSRRRVVLEKAAGLGISLFVLGLVVWVVLGVSGFLFEVHVGLGNLAAAVVLLLLLASTFAAAAYAIGCLRGRKGFAIALASGLALASYLLDSLGNLTESLKPFQRISPWNLYTRHDPLAHGMDWAAGGILLALTLGLVLLSAWGFERRDVGG